ncbi:bestrophin-like domain [Chitinasiproducens palmae]|uniref:DUF4239 domain-containing protein n=1 Tax=Chitinasiproducens palmae TaxID=1770053 RepID=A0A1H2PK14_9BURK|nr:DUF4239 domain-containing protein [Chitinasiproducens palmae]SDV46220.1 Protein of unknown function [Chitinasiproducens palmae]
MSFGDYRHLLISVGLTLLMVGATWIGMHLRLRLPVHHRDRDTAQVLNAIFTMLVTFTAIVLGLLITAKKSEFETTGHSVQLFASRLIELDRLFRQRGPVAQPAHGMLRDYLQLSIDSAHHRPPTPRENPRSGFGGIAEGALFDKIERDVRAWPSPDATALRLQTDSLDLMRSLTDLRWQMIENTNGVADAPFFAVLVLWLVMMFVVFSLSATRNALVFATVFGAAVTIGASLFLIFELQTPFDGLITISPRPIADALAYVER